MARIFISHSSINNAEAIALRDWLISEGWDDLFLDLDSERGIVAGERWERALHEAANRSRKLLVKTGQATFSTDLALAIAELRQPLQLSALFHATDKITKVRNRRRHAHQAF